LSGSVAVSGYVPYSGSTGSLGRIAPLVELPMSLPPLDPNALASALRDPQALAPTIGAALALSSRAKIALVELPELALSLRTLAGATILVNDPDNSLTLDAPRPSTALSAMLLMPGILTALAARGAAGAVVILDRPERAARGEYAPFFGALTPNLPALYVDRTVGAALKSAAAGPSPMGAKLVLDAALSTASSENVVALLPGASDKEILLSSHTDGPNSIEDNGPVAILGLTACLEGLGPAERPRTIRIVLSGGHFAGSLGLQTYALEHALDLKERALAVMELEHLGAREWTESSPGALGLTGWPEAQILYTWPNAPLVEASSAFAYRLPRSVVGPPPLLGEGQNYRVAPLIQFITAPEYRLLGHLPEITSRFTGR
jgi:hypothetical protein